MAPTDRFVSENSFFVRYAETDAMAIVHHSTYIVYFEEARGYYSRVQGADYADFDQFTTDIAQFSSAILLNNLSVSMSKYLGRRFFLDYELELQEATDLEKKTKLMISHSTSVRLMLPWKLRLGYTFEYTPRDERFTHEIMMQRSFSFWGF